MASPSKSVFMGQNLRRLPRSELEDSTMRDLNRHDVRLSENLRTVERARGVVLKSLESDKKNFIRGGVSSNKKVVKSNKSPSATAQASSLQNHKYLPDTRNRRAYEQMFMTRRPSREVIQSFKPIRSKTDLSDTRSTSSKKQIDTGREEDLNNNGTFRPGSADDELERVKSDRVSSTSPSDNNPEYRSRASTTPTIKIDDYDRVSTSPHRDDDGKPGVSDMVNGKDRNTSPQGEMITPDNITPKRQSSFVQPASTMPLPFSDDYYFGRRQPTFWEYLSTPKNPSMHRQKREQLEKEFALRSRDVASASGKSAKGQRSTVPVKLWSTADKIPTTPRAKSSTGTTRKSTTPKSTLTTGKGNQSIYK